MHLLITIPLLIAAFVLIISIARHEHIEGMKRVRKEFPGPKHARTSIRWEG